MLYQADGASVIGGALADRGPIKVRAVLDDPAWQRPFTGTLLCDMMAACVRLIVLACLADGP